MLINGKPFQVKCHEIGCAELSEKVAVFKKYVFLKSSSSDKAAVRMKHLLRKSTCSE